MENAAVALYGWLAFNTIAGLTWFFSSRPRLFIRIFGGGDEWRGLARTTLRDPKGWQRSMRNMAVLQFAVGSVFWLIILLL